MAYNVVRYGTAATGNVVTGSTIAPNFSVAPANGNAGICLVGIVTASVTVSSIAQTGATWSLIRRFTVAGSVLSIEEWGAPNFSSAGTGVTVTLSSGGIGRAAIAAEVSGFGGTINTDKFNDNNATSATADTGSTATTTQANEFWCSGFWNHDVAMISGTGLYSAPTNGYTLGQQISAGDSSQFNLALCWKNVTSTAAAGNALTIDESSIWIATATSLYGAAASTAVPLVPVLGA